LPSDFFAGTATTSRRAAGASTAPSSGPGGVARQGRRKASANLDRLGLSSRHLGRLELLLPGTDGASPASTSQTSNYRTSTRSVFSRWRILVMPSLALHPTSPRRLAGELHYGKIGFRYCRLAARPSWTSCNQVPSCRPAAPGLQPDSTMAEGTHSNAHTQVTSSNFSKISSSHVTTGAASARCSPVLAVSSCSSKMPFRDDRRPLRLLHGSGSRAKPAGHHHQAADMVVACAAVDPS